MRDRGAPFDRYSTRATGGEGEGEGKFGEKTHNRGAAEHKFEVGFGFGGRESLMSAGLVQQPDEVSRTVYIGNIPPSITLEQFLGLFATCGPISFYRLSERKGDITPSHSSSSSTSTPIDSLSSSLPDSFLSDSSPSTTTTSSTVSTTSSTSYTKFAFIEFTEREGYDNAMALNGYCFFGKPLRVNDSHNPVRKPLYTDPTALPASTLRDFLLAVAKINTKIGVRDPDLLDRISHLDPNH